MKNLFLILFAGLFAGLFAVSAAAEEFNRTSAYHCKTTAEPNLTIEIIEDQSAGTANVIISNANGPIISQEVRFSSEYQAVPGQPYKLIKNWRSDEVQILGTFFPELPSRNFSATALWRGQDKKVSFACTF